MFATAVMRGQCSDDDGGGSNRVVVVGAGRVHGAGQSRQFVERSEWDAGGRTHRRVRVHAPIRPELKWRAMYRPGCRGAKCAEQLAPPAPHRRRFNCRAASDSTRADMYARPAARAHHGLVSLYPTGSSGSSSTRRRGHVCVCVCVSHIRRRLCAARERRKRRRGANSTTRSDKAQFAILRDMRTRALSSIRRPPPPPHTRTHANFGYTRAAGQVRHGARYRRAARDIQHARARASARAAIVVASCYGACAALLAKTARKKALATAVAGRPRQQRRRPRRRLRATPAMATFRQGKARWKRNKRPTSPPPPPPSRPEQRSGRRRPSGGCSGGKRARRV